MASPVKRASCAAAQPPHLVAIPLGVTAREGSSPPRPLAFRGCLPFFSAVFVALLVCLCGVCGRRPLAEQLTPRMQAVVGGALPLGTHPMPSHQSRNLAGYAPDAYLGALWTGSRGLRGGLGCGVLESVFGGHSIASHCCHERRPRLEPPSAGTLPHRCSLWAASRFRFPLHGHTGRFVFLRAGFSHGGRPCILLGEVKAMERVGGGAGSNHKVVCRRGKSTRSNVVAGSGPCAACVVGRR